MKFTKRLTALLLCAVCVCALVCVPPAGAASTVSTFPDVTDPQVGRAVEALRVMGVIDGGGDGRYDPDGSLTRAAFCKMAILVMGKGDEADAQASRTIFNDVPAKHWARGYVNLAALTTVGGGEDGKGGARLMLGLGNGSFAPDRVISYGEAVTILLRMLGYAKEANLNWPNGAVSTAAAVGLTAGFTPPKAGAPVTRAQAALLFCNMLTTPLSGTKDETYLDFLGYDVKKGALLLASNATENGKSGYVKIFTGTEGSDRPVLPAVRNPAAFLEGTRGTAVFDKPGVEGKFLTFLPDAASTSKTITIAKVSGRVITATDGSSFTVASDTPVWTNGKPDNFSAVLTSLSQGNTSVTICFASSGAVESLFVHGTTMTLSGGVMVAREKVSGNPFAQLTAGTTDYKLVKNGVEVTTAALQQYDVAAFDPTNKTLYVTNFRLTGVYESAFPNTAVPTKIRLSLFKEDLEVLDSAVDDLKGLKLGSSVTLLLSPDGKVAGAVSSSTLRSNTVGYVDGDKVHLLNAPSGLPELNSEISGDLNKYRDSLVTVTGGKGVVYLSRINGRSPSSALDVDKRTIGSAPLAENVAVFDRITNSGMKRITLADIAMDSVPAAKIAYQRVNAAGEVDLLLLENATGDLYTYGIAKVETKGDEPEPPSSGTDKGENQPTTTTSTDKVINTFTTVTNSSKSLTVVGGTRYKSGQFIGLAASVTAKEIEGKPRSAGSVALKSVEKVSPSNFNLNTGIFFSRSIELPISSEVQCYNAQTRKWFGEDDKEKDPMDNLNDCLAYSSDLTVYYDRDPAQGGKVRVVVAH